MTNFDEIRDLISSDLERLQKIIKQSLSSNSPLLNKIVDKYLETKGKQIRPIIVVLSAKFFGAEVSDGVLCGAASVELLHNASLIHDDVIDETKQRRGHDTINNTWDNHIAVLVGDFFVSNALACAIRTNDFRVISTISELGKELSTGEIDQIDVAKHHSIDEQTYFSIINKKTASLFQSCVKVGGYSVGASDIDIANLSKFVELLGLSFQIKDDIFDYFKDDAIGKPTGNDMREGKVTLPLIYALSHMPGSLHILQQAVHSDLRIVAHRRSAPRRDAPSCRLRLAYHRTDRDADRLCQGRGRNRICLCHDGASARRGTQHP